MADRGKSHVNVGYEADSDEPNPTAGAERAPPSNNLCNLYVANDSDDSPPISDGSVSSNSSPTCDENKTPYFPTRDRGAPERIRVPLSGCDDPGGSEGTGMLHVDGTVRRVPHSSTSSSGSSSATSGISNIVNPSSSSDNSTSSSGSYSATSGISNIAYPSGLSDSSTSSSGSSSATLGISNIVNPSSSSDNSTSSSGSYSATSGISNIAYPSGLSDETSQDTREPPGLCLVPQGTFTPETVSNPTRDLPHTSSNGYRPQQSLRPQNNNHQEYWERVPDARNEDPPGRKMALPDRIAIPVIRGTTRSFQVRENPTNDEDPGRENIEAFQERYPERITEQRGPGVARKSVRCIGQRCCVVFFVLAAVSVVAGTMFLILYNSFGATFFAKATLQMRVKEPFQVDLLTLSSPLATNYTTRLCEGMAVSLNNQSQVDKLQDCQVISFSNGSIKVVMNLSIVMTTNVSKPEFLQDVLKSGHLPLPGIPVYPDSVRIISFSLTEVSDSRVSPAPPTTTPASTPSADPEFLCSEGGELYKPYSYTYPSHCGLYQRCDNGHSIHQSCDAGLEFGYHPDSILGPCRHPSNTTYCGTKRLQQTVTSPSTVTAVTSAMTVTSSTTANRCSSIHPLILNNSPSLYSCQGSGPQSFRPHEDTYPDNCSTFQWCKDGKLLNITQCAKGSSFVFEESQAKSCYPENDPETFCEQMKLAETCR